MKTLHNCYNCDSDNIKISFGALFGGASYFCADCGCQGGMSKTEPAMPDDEKRIGEAADIWNKGFIQRTKWDHFGGRYIWPPVHYKNIIELRSYHANIPRLQNRKRHTTNSITDKAGKSNSDYISRLYILPEAKNLHCRAGKMLLFNRETYL